MIAVLFQVDLLPGKRAAYLELASALAVPLMQADGFLGVERFQSLARPERLLSVSLWRDEGSALGWHAQPDHRSAQAQGRAHIFEDYLLRVSEVRREYGMGGAK